MTDEEKKAIEYIEYQVKTGNLIREYTDIYYFQEELQIALNLIQKQQEELTRTKTYLQNSWHNNLELAEKCLKQDKIIDLMVNAMAKNHCSIIDIVQEYICNNRCIGNNDWNCEKCIKQYFEKKVGE